MVKTNQHRCWGCIIGEPSQLLEKAQTSHLAFHGIHVKVVQDIKCECGLGPDETGRKQTMSEKLDVMRGRSWASTPLDVVMENPSAVSNDKSILTSPHLHPPLMALAPLHPPLPRARPSAPGVDTYSMGSSGLGRILHGVPGA